MNTFPLDLAGKAFLVTGAARDLSGQGLLVDGGVTLP